MTRCYPSGDAEGAQLVLKSVRRAGRRVQFDAALLRTWLRRLVPQPRVSRLLPPATTTGTVTMLDLWRVTSQGLLLTDRARPGAPVGPVPWCCAGRKESPHVPQWFR